MTKYYLRRCKEQTHKFTNRQNIKTRREEKNKQKQKQIVSSKNLNNGGFILPARQRCDEQCNCCDGEAKSLLFCRVATIVFCSCCLVILMTFVYDFRWQLLSDGSDIAKKLK